MFVSQSDPACLIAGEDNCNRYQDLQAKLGQTFDPYGITTTLLRAQQAWREHPREAMTAARHLSREPDLAAPPCSPAKTIPNSGSSSLLVAFIQTVLPCWAT